MILFLYLLGVRCVIFCFCLWRVLMCLDSGVGFLFLWCLVCSFFMRFVFVVFWVRFFFVLECWAGFLQ